jgi:kynureninase
MSTTPHPDRSEAERLDGTDPLGPFRARFTIADDSLVYLDGNSLGRMPSSVPERIGRLLDDEWARDLISSWGTWIDVPRQVGDLVGGLIGARPGEVVVHDSVTVNLYQLVHAAASLVPNRHTFVVEAGEFPTDRYVVEGVAETLGKRVRAGVDEIDDDTAVIVRSLVDYRSGEVADMVGATRQATDAGAVVIWDLSHAVGSIEIDLAAAGVDFAVGCTYKYLNAGPGAPAFSYVSARALPGVRTPLRGWFGHADQFDMDAPFVAHPDARALLLGSPGLLGLTAAREGIALVAEAGMPAIAAKGRALTAYGIELCDAFGLEVTSPRDATRRGAHFSVRHPDARAIVGELASGGVVTDFRTPDLVRIGCSALTTRFTDVFDGVAALAGAVAQRR